MRFASFSLLRNQPQVAFVQYRHVKRAQRTENLNRVFRLERSVRDRKHSTRAALETKQGRRGIFYFTIEQNIRSHRSDFRDRTQEVAEYFNAMTAKVEHRPTPSEIFIKQPGSRMVGWWIKPFERIDLDQHWRSDFAGFDHALKA